MLAKALTSCLNAAAVARLKFEPYTEDSNNLEVSPRWAGFKIPYFTLDGKVDKEFYRFRYLQTQPSKGFSSLTEEPAKPLRYSQPAGSTCGVYLPPLLPQGVTWRDVAKDPATRLLLTEGELKAACACSLGDVCVGLGGVYNWRSSRLHQELLPILEEFVWAGRKVTICFDSDISTNAQVRAAASRLAAVLAQRGAAVSWVSLPPAADGSKQGLDDLVYGSGGEEALLRALAAAEEVGPGAPLHTMNGQVALVRSTGEVVELATGNVYSASAFSDVVYRSSTYADWTVKAAKEGEDKPTSKQTRKYTAKEWLAWPLRTEVSRLEYAPDCDRQTTEDGAYNTWYAQRWPVEPSAAGSIEPWTELFEHIFGSLTARHATWVTQWFAYPLQNPGCKLASALLVWGRQQGTGKTMIGETFAAIYGKNYGTVNNMQLASQFNEWALDKQFIVGDEISLGDKRGTANSLKDMITRPTLRMNIKNRKSYVVRDCANYYFTSNHEDAIFLENADRRIFVHHSDVQPLASSYYQAYQRWLRHEGGAARLFHYFLHEVDLADFDAQGRAPITAAKLEMTASGRGDTEDWAVQLRSDPDSLLPTDRHPYDLWRTTDLLAIYDPDHREKTKVIGLGRALAAAGVVKIANGNNSMVIDGVRSRLWAVRNSVRYKRVGPQEARRLYEEERASLAPGGRKFDARSSGRVQ
jgi:hypothetical protein